MTEPANDLNRMRTDAGVSQEALAYHLGVSAKTPYNWEHLPPDKLKKYHRLAYAAAIERALEDTLIARYVGDAHPGQMAFALAS